MLTPSQTDQNEFTKVFGIPYSRFDTITGFDILAFDDWLKAGDESVQDVVSKRFGSSAVDLLCRIIKADVDKIQFVASVNR